MNLSSFLVQAVIYLSSAIILVPIFKRLGLGSVLGYLIAGIIIGPYALKLIPEPEQVLHFAEFGVVMMLFLIGLELDPQKAWNMRKLLFGLGGTQVLLTILLVMLVGHWFNLSWSVALVVGIGVAMSSTAIGLTSLEEKRLLTSEGGQASFVTLLFQDLSVIPLFMLLALIAPSHDHADFDLWSVVKAIAVITALVLASRTLLKPLMRIVAETGMREIFVAFSLLLVIGVSLAMESVGLSMGLGTFMAGVLLANSEYSYELRLDIEPVKGLLLGLFFIAVGMSVDVSLLIKSPLLILGLALAVVALKLVILMGLGRIFKYRFRDVLLFGVALSQIGEFAFVIFGVALSQNTISQDLYNILNAIVAVSMLLTPLLFVLYEFIIGKECGEKPEQDEIETEHPIIIAGFGRFGQVVGRVLLARGLPATLIDNDPNQVTLMREFGWRCYYGDAARLDLLKQAGIDKAALLVIAIDSAEQTLEIAELVRQKWPQVKIVVRARSRTDAYDLREKGLQPIRETFYSALEAARQSLLAIGESERVASRAVRQFEKHDLDLLDATLKVRHDRKAVMNMTEKGRQDLQSLFEQEMAESEVTESAR